MFDPAGQPRLFRCRTKLLRCDISPIILNGKFYSGVLNGVHRVADRLITQIDRIVTALPPAARPDIRIYLPAERQWSPRVQSIRVIEQSGAQRQLWEQFALPWLARGGVLVSLCNLGPLVHSRSILLIHDAQYFFSDSSYPFRQRLGYKLAIPLVARAARKVLTVSEYSRQTLDLTGVAGRDRTSVLYNGADHILESTPAEGVLARFGLAPRSYVLAFGSSKEYKNLRVVFEAARRDEFGDLALLLIGESAAALRAGGLVPPPNAIFAGAIDDDSLRSLYQHAACLAFPSRTEGFGLPPVEAMLCGCPAVVAPGGAIPEICRDAVIYADIDDAAEWARAFATIRDDRALRSAKIAAGRARAAEFTWERSGRQLFDMIMELARS